MYFMETNRTKILQIRDGSETLTLPSCVCVLQNKYVLPSLLDIVVGLLGRWVSG